MQIETDKCREDFLYCHSTTVCIKMNDSDAAYSNGPWWTKFYEIDVYQIQIAVLLIRYICHSFSFNERNIWFVKNAIYIYAFEVAHALVLWGTI